jgi:signal transduction histidine kinase
MNQRSRAKRIVASRRTSGSARTSGSTRAAADRAAAATATDAAASALSDRIEQLREEERTRIARELHDELGQLLTGMKLDFSATIRRLRDARPPLDVANRLQSAIGQVDLAIAVVRRIASDLRPAPLDHQDLGGAIEYEARRVAARSGLRIGVLNRATLPVAPDHATAAFRIFQESLTNVIRHARATRVTAAVTTTSRLGLTLRVRDDGIGVPAARLHANTSLGFLGMRERARALGGRIRITTPPGGGTLVFLTLPLRPARTTRR